MMIPFLKQEDLILDNNRQIIPGAKIEVFDPVSNTHVNIYTYDGSNERYTVATNPVYLNLQSRPEHTYFADRLVLCRLYKYIGNFSDPRVDDDTNNWKFIREWNGAFQQDTVKNDTIIFGIESLAEANPNLGSVTVVGYWNNTDCEARTYVWDGNCVQTPDNGYIVKNSDLDAGRWILKFDGEYLPSTYYGVYPGHEANINALLGYVESVGTAGTKTAPGVYFVPGTYDASTTALSTSKKLLIDANTTFTRSVIYCNDVDVIGHVTHAICNFYVSNTTATVHSSWFKSPQYFWSCNAHEFIIDANNFFEDSTMNTGVSLVNKVIVGNNRLPVTAYNNDCMLILNNCIFVGKSLFNAATDYVRFFNTTINDEIFSNLDLADVGDTTAHAHHIDIRIASPFNNTLLLSKFKTTSFYRQLLEFNNVATLDGENRTFDGFTNTVFTTIKNVVVGSGAITNNINSALTLDNCKLSINSSNSSLVINDSEIYVYDWTNISSVTVRNSTINAAQSLDAYNTQVSLVDTNFRATIIDSDTNYNPTKSIIIKRSTLPYAITATNIDAEDSQFGNLITIYPQVSDNACTLNASFKGCKFTGAGEVLFTLRSFGTGIAKATPFLTFIGNTFEGNSEYGIRMPFYRDVSSTGEFLDVTYGNCLYRDNHGKCPLESIDIAYFDSWTQFDYANTSYRSSATAYRLWDLGGGYNTMDSHGASAYNGIRNCAINGMEVDISTSLASVNDQSPAFVLPTTVKTSSLINGLAGLSSGGSVDGYGDMFEVKLVVTDSAYTNGHYLYMTWKNWNNK